MQHHWILAPIFSSGFWISSTPLELPQIQPPNVHPPQVRTGERILLEKPSGEVEARELASFDCTDPRTLGAWIVGFERPTTALSSAPEDERAEVTLHGGDRLFGRVRGGRAELIDVEITAGVHLGLALDEIASLIFPARVPALGSVAPTAPKEGDRLYRRAGGGLDAIDGGVEEFTSDGVRIHGESVGNKTVPWSEIAALFVEGLAGAGTAKGAASAGVPLVVDLSDGSRLRGTLERLSTEGCRLVTRNGERVLLPSSALALALVDDGTLAFLSSIPPSEAPPSLPFGDDLGMRWPLHVDRSVTGARLFAGGKIFARGLGVHAPSRITWKLDGGWKHLRGLAAVDDQVLRLPSRGSVVFRVLLDGKPVWESRVMHAGDPPVALGAVALGSVAGGVRTGGLGADASIDLAGARELSLEVGDSDGSSVADRADWLQLVLWR